MIQLLKEVVWWDALCNFEIVLLTAFAVLALLTWRTAEKLLLAGRRLLKRLATRIGLSSAAVALAIVLARVALLGVAPAPRPHVHDEFSLLLGASTFASGRLTNPSHPFWQHFESFHIIQQPTYMSIYPPAQAAVLAIGILLGHPWIGVLLSVAAMIMAAVWMLQAWTPRWLALFGGVLVGLRFGLSGYWVDSYWGGTVAAAAAAILLGAFGRIWRSKDPRLCHALLLGVGIAVLVNRRPFEGGMLSALTLACLAYWLFWRVRDHRWRAFRNLILPLVAVLVPTAAWVGYFNWRITGNPMLMPYVHGIQTYGIARHTLWIPAAPEPAYRHAAMKDFYRWELSFYETRKRQFLLTTAEFALKLWKFYVGPALSVPLLVLPWVVRRRGLWTLLGILGASVAVMATETWIYPHYAAPLAPILWLLLLLCMRHLHRCWRPWGAALLAASLATSITMGLIITATKARASNSDGRSFQSERRTIEMRLASIGGSHLVLVRYRPGHSFHDEWVYNEPDIDRSRIVWAHEMGDESDKRLEAYFRGRRVWLLEVGASVESFKPIETSGL